MTGIRGVPQADVHLKLCSVTPHDVIVILSLGVGKLEVQHIDSGVVEIADCFGPAEANISE